MLGTSTIQLKKWVSPKLMVGDFTLCMSWRVQVTQSIVVKLEQVTLMFIRYGYEGTHSLSPGDLLDSSCGGTLTLSVAGLQRVFTSLPPVVRNPERLFSSLAHSFSQRGLSKKRVFGPKQLRRLGLSVEWHPFSFSFFWVAALMVQAPKRGTPFVSPGSLNNVLPEPVGLERQLHLRQVPKSKAKRRVRAEPSGEEFIPGLVGWLAG